MVEVPALLFQLDEILKRADFLSVGSNDLFQFLFAVDRGNSKVSERFDTLSAPVLRALRTIVARRADAAGKSVIAVRRIGLAAARARWRCLRSVTVRCRYRQPPMARSRP